MDESDRTVCGVLEAEHALVRRAAACLSALADEALESGELDAASAAELVELFEDFADGVHQEKEERCLFPALVRAGLRAGRVAELASEHRAERRLLHSLRAGLEGAAYGHPRRA